MATLSKTASLLTKISPFASKARAVTQVPSLTQNREFTAAKASPVSQYGGRYTVTMIPGDGIGPEMMGYVKDIFRYAGVPVDFEEVPLDHDSSETEFDNAITAIRRNGVAIKGSIESEYGALSVVSRNARLRMDLDLFANVLHIKSYPSVRSVYKDVDIIIIRQNTQGEYSMMEHESVPGVVESMKVVTRDETTRLAKYALEYARAHGRKRLTIVHKANIMKLADGLFLQTCKDVAKDYPDIEVNDMIVDNTCMQIVAKPHQFDVVITPNLYGNVVANVACGLVGGPGLTSGRNYGDHFAVFEPGTRGTGTAVAGRNIANPIAMLNASCDLLDHLTLTEHSKVIRGALEKTLTEDQVHTSDLGGQATTIEVIQHVVDNIRVATAGSTWKL